MKSYFRPFVSLLGGALAVCTTAAFRPAPPARPFGTQANEAVSVYLTYGDKSKLLQQQSNVSFGPDSGTNSTTITVDENTTYQSIDGFGGAMTGSSAYVFNRLLNSSQRDALFSDLFGSGGVNFSFMRHSIGASDFSLSSYTYDDVAAGQTDFGLNSFSIGPDQADVVPMLKAALAKNSSLRIVGTPWSPPAWMKNDFTLNGSSLADDKYGVYADYFVRYVQAFGNEGIPIWGITLQNEPFTASDYYPSSQMFSYQESNFLKNHIGPKFANAGLNTKLIVFDDSWASPQYAGEVFADGGARQYAAGTAFHCYAGNAEDGQSPVHNAYPDKGIWMTECSGGDFSPVFGDNLKFLVSNLLIASTRNWGQGVLMWNLALDENHGPRNNGCVDCRGVVTIDSNTGNVTRNEEYYAFGHASKFVKQGAVRIASNNFSGGIENVAFKNPDGSKALLALNSGSSQTTFKVKWGNESFNYTLPAGAVATFKWSGTQGGGGTIIPPPSSGLTAGHAYKIKSGYSGKLLDVDGPTYDNGTRVQQYEDVNDSGQQWKLLDAGNGEYQFQNRYSGKVLDIDGPSMANGARAQQYDNYYSANQKFRIVSLGNSQYKIESVYSGKVLDVDGPSMANGATVQQYDDYTGQGAQNQMWTFEDLGVAKPGAVLATRAPASEELRLQVYPVPAASELQVEYTALARQTLQLQLVDMLGRRVGASRPEAVVPGLNRLRVPVASVAAGVYQLRVRTSAGLLSRRVVVAR